MHTVAPSPVPELLTHPSTALQLMVLSLLPKMEDANSLPPVTARACLPYWLEAAGWAAALMSDATAAAMGRLPSTERDEHSVHMLSPVSLPICSDVAVTTVTFRFCTSGASGRQLQSPG